MESTVASHGSSSARERVLEAAATLLTQEGRDAVSTRAVAAAAGLQAPAIYRLFGDKQGLLDALGELGFAEYLAAKSAAPAPDDPVAAVRAGWDNHVAFGLEQPAFYRLVYGDPRPGGSPAARRADGLLRDLLGHVARAGRLQTTVERAAQVIAAGSVGVVFTLLATPEVERDPELSVTTREALLGRVLTDSRQAGRDDAARLAVTLSETLRRDPGAAGLTAPERALLEQWLARIADA